MKLWSVALLLPLTLVACGQGQTASRSAADHEVVELPIETIFDQGHSDWCWAFSAYHTLRTYYANAASTAAGVSSWRAALQPLDSQEAFTGYLSSHFDQGHTGNPLAFVELMETERQTSRAPWTDFYPTEHESDGPAAPDDQAQEHLATPDILAKVQANLRRQVPAVFCNTEHCRMIYGMTLDGGAVTSYSFADSLGSRRTYQVDAGEAADTLDVVMTLP